MRELIADLFVSLEGFAAGENAGPYFGYSGPELENWVRRELAKPQTIVMGRKTFEVMSDFARSDDPASLRMAELPKLVVTRSKPELPPWRNTSLLSGEAAEELRKLKAQDGDQLRIMGSISVVRCCMSEGLLDRLRLMVFPLTLGTDGKEWIYEGFPRAAFELAAVEKLDDRLMCLDYRRLPGKGD